MKGIFVAYDQAYNMDIADAIQKIGVRGFTMWQDIAGRGSETGEPHLGSHAWRDRRASSGQPCMAYNEQCNAYFRS